MARERKIVFTKEQEADIIAMHKAGLPWREIQARHNIHSPSTVKRVLMDNGIDVSVGGKPTAKGKKCECGHVAPVGSKFCNMCGKLLLTEDEKVIEGLLKARNNAIRYMPANMQNEADEAMLKAINLLKIKCGVV